MQGRRNERRRDPGMAEGTLSKQTQKILKSKGFPLIYLHECGDDISSFSKALGNAVDYNTFGPFVSKHTPEDLRESRALTFLSRDRMAGIAVWPDGNIGAAFNDRRSRNRKAIGELMLTALSAGGNKLDCFDGFLRRAYAKFGFTPVARVKFDWNYAPENWQKKFKEPDVIFWVHCGDPVELVAKKINSYPTYNQEYVNSLRYFDSYEAAYQYRDDLLA